jgi:hypothetical protein
MSSRLDDARRALDRVRADRAAQPPSLFDQPPAYLQTVEANASEQWNEHALDAIRAAARVHPELTVDDVHPFITEPVHDLRALGPVMLRAARDGVIRRKPGAYRTSDRPETHSRPLAVWTSLLYRWEP